MKLKLLAASLLMVGSSATFASSPMTFSDIDALQSQGTMRMAQLTTEEMDRTEGNAIPLVVWGLIAAGAAGGAGHVVNSPNPNWAGFAWGVGTGFTGAAMIAAAPTLPLAGGVAATFAGSMVAVAPMPALPTWDPIMESCSIFGTVCGR